MHPGMALKYGKQIPVPPPNGLKKWDPPFSFILDDVQNLEADLLEAQFSEEPGKNKMRIPLKEFRFKPLTQIIKYTTTDPVLRSVQWFLCLTIKFPNVRHHTWEPAPWISDTASNTCLVCQIEFTMTRRRHHCRACGQLLCDACTPHKALLPGLGPKKVRICRACQAGLPTSHLEPKALLFDKEEVERKKIEDKKLAEKNAEDEQKQQLEDAYFEIPIGTIQSPALVVPEPILSLIEQTDKWDPEYMSSLSNEGKKVKKLHGDDLSLLPRIDFEPTRGIFLPLTLGTDAPFLVAECQVRFWKEFLSRPALLRKEKGCTFYVDKGGPETSYEAVIGGKNIFLSTKAETELMSPWQRLKTHCGQALQGPLTIYVRTRYGLPEYDGGQLLLFDDLGILCAQEAETTKEKFWHRSSILQTMVIKYDSSGNELERLRLFETGKIKGAKRRDGVIRWMILPNTQPEFWFFCDGPLKLEKQVWIDGAMYGVVLPGSR